MNGHLEQPHTLLHSRLVRITHWCNVIAFTFLVISGVAIFFAHPEFYWGEDGYYGYDTAISFNLDMNIMHAMWGRNYHFLFAWVFVINGVTYLLLGIIRGHIFDKIIPKIRELRIKNIISEFWSHVHFQGRNQDASLSYNVLQKSTYTVVIFLLCPLMFMTGLSMSPAVTAAIPDLPQFFGGRQSARTIHFLVANLLVLFVVIHLMQIFILGAVNTVYPMITGTPLHNSRKN